MKYNKLSKIIIAKYIKNLNNFIQLENFTIINV